MGIRARRDHDDGDGGHPAQGAAGLEPIDSGEHEVDQHEFVWLGRKAVDGLLAAADTINGVPLLFQGEAHGGADPLVILDDQDATHGPIMTRPPHP